jgi:hypothetical protein
LSERFVFNAKRDFLGKIRELLDSGVAAKRITALSPYPVHELDELLPSAPSPVRFFALVGAVAGLLGGFAFTVYTVKVWPLISGGKPLVSIPAFLIIAFELTILFGAILSFVGFLHFCRIPDLRRIISTEDFENKFEIIVSEKEGQ